MSTVGHSMRLASGADYLPERGAQPRDVEPQPLIDLSKKPWLSPREAAVYLSLPTVDALRSRMKRGTLPLWAWTKLGGSLRFSRAALDELLSGRPADARTLRAVTSSKR